MDSTTSPQQDQPVKYFHGGIGGLNVGDLVLPPCETGAKSNASFGAAHVCRRDRVYIATALDNAVMFAALSVCGKGDAYEVEPIGDLSPDPDCYEPGLSWECQRARVVRVYRLCNRTRKRWRKAVMRDFRITNGIPDDFRRPGALAAPRTPA